MRRTLRERELLRPGARVLVAVSGGPDSAALLDVLRRLDELALDLRAASVDHGLRPGSADDVATARALAERLGVEFHALAVEVKGEGASLQAHAREARYAALRGLAAELRADAIAVGHTLDDQAETVLSRMLRGASLTGLAGIEPRRADGVIRPLLDCRREAVRAHVARFGLPHVTDPSNHDDRFERVRLREVVIPTLLEEDPAVVEHLAGLADEARSIRAWVDLEAGRLLEARERPEVLRLAGPEPVRTRAIGRWIEEITGARAKRAHLVALGRGDETLLAGGWVARPSGDRIVAAREGDRPTRSRAAEE
ncbi:MAG: tRNA lysidine(34) synthetase TilS [Sandaracinaceae bacterium]|nr:tRNA lysidine(34) synthetase TilS [Sandaracinaceae bacterium]